jgi:hypothetical protein
MKYILFKDWEVTKRFKDWWLQNSLICYLRFVVTSEVNMLLKMSIKLDLTITIFDHYDFGTIGLSKMIINMTVWSYGKDIQANSFFSLVPY